MPETKKVIQAEIEEAEKKVISLAKEFISIPEHPRYIAKHLEILDSQIETIKLAKNLKKLLK